MESLQPVLFGLTTIDKLWPWIHPPLLLGWAPLLVAPRWKHTSTITLLVPLAHGILYSLILLPMMFQSQEALDLNNMESIFQMFAVPEIFFCGWLHYLAFDLLVGRGIAEDALKICKVSNFQYYAMVVPCLAFCFYSGPVGYSMYMALRTFVFAPPKTQ